MSGRLDRVDNGTAEGWAVSPEEEEDCARIEILIDGKLVTSIKAGLYRPDLAAAGVRSGYAKFLFRIPVRFHDGKAHEIDVRHEGTSVSLDGAPMRFSFGIDDPTIVEKRSNTLRTLVLQNDAHGDEFADLVKAKRAVALVSTYHDTTRFMLYHETLFRTLADAGYVVVIVHASGPSVDRIQPFCYPACHTIIKRNVGYDFGSWAIGSYAIESVIDDVDEILLVNDSIITLDSKELQRLIVRSRENGADVVGITESYERTYHLQSYFLWLGARFCKSSSFRLFMAGYSFSSNKETVIKEGELGFTTRVLMDGFSVACLISYEQIANHWLSRLRNTEAEIRALPSLPNRDGGSTYKYELLERLDRVAALVLNGTPVNPSHFFWDTLIEQFNFPFLKREFVLVNPCSVPTYFRLGRVLATMSDTHISIMELRRIYGGPLVPVFWRDEGADRPDNVSDLPDRSDAKKRLETPLERRSATGRILHA